jgi:alkanesulfonate monooxygenase SsuD/methylene tetrahydromethanopterin reductase-like flavin-dependent oxidoreductase (luciferase family)
MEIGLVSLGDWLPDPVTGRRISQVDRFRQIVELGVLADELGFVTFHVGEHHFSEYAVSSPAVMLAAIAERTTSVRLSTAVSLLPHHDAVRVAEDYATVDVLSSGRVEMIAGRGVYHEHYQHFGGSWDESDAMLSESVDLLRQLWSNERVSWRGTWRGPLDDVTVHPRPVQQPHPPVWLSASSLASVVRAVSLGCPIMIPTISTGVALPAELAAAYRRDWLLAGRDPADAHVGLHVHLHVGASTTAEARQFWAPYQESYLGWVLREIRGKSGPLPATLLVGDDPAAQGVCADIDDTYAELARRCEAIGQVDRVLVQCDQGGLPAEETTAAIRRFATDVVPRLTALAWRRSEGN